MMDSMSWNGFPRKLSLKLIEQLQPPVQTPIDHETQVDITRMWVQTTMIRKFGYLYPTLENMEPDLPAHLYIE